MMLATTVTRGTRDASKSRIAVIGTGGTFAMHARHPFDWVEYGESGIVHPIDALLETLGNLGDVSRDVEIVAIPFRTLGSTGITPRDWVDLATLIQSAAKQDASLTGFVVTHGTATLEETAWFLELTLDVGVPVVLTGAQRPANTAGSDAVANLRAALAVAKRPATVELGVVVVMDNYIFGAKDVSKGASFDLDAFEAVPYGPLGRVDADGSVKIHRTPLRNRISSSASLSFSGDLPRVDVVMSYAGADRVQIDACVAAGAKAIVSAGLPPGRPANAEFAGLEDAVKAGVVVVQSTRALRGVVPSQAFLRAKGILAGGDLSPQKARILLMVAMSRSMPRQAIQEWLLAA
ncbi:asparaginase [Cupriavidus pinatubonensis]|uniref:Asparaginase n=1 Tax=Cupriavidus pinatubonensis TaxID=248026 RepID=A0ABM8Y4H7_9BURK|nr:asparaginase [Cupriavidus pinatubonensis]CAG9187578.1 hypothetical protein LMG23994_07023 [Cupriavidus pinatubonensis]